MLLPKICPSCGKDLFEKIHANGKSVCCKLCELYFDILFDSEFVTCLAFVLNEDRSCLYLPEGGFNDFLFVMDKCVIDFDNCILGDWSSRKRYRVPGLEFDFSNMKRLRNKLKIYLIFC